MSSIKEEISGETIANDVRLQRATHKGSFLLVEGSDDANLFKKFSDSQQCSIIVCLGRRRLLEAITVLEKAAFSGALGIADKDFADFVGFPTFEGKVVFTDENDIEIMILCSPALDNLLGEFGAKDRVSAIVESGGKQVCDLVFDAASFVGALRLVSQVEGWSLSFEGMTYQFIDLNSYCFDESKTVRHVLGRSKRRPCMTNDEILTRVQEQVSQIDMAKKLCCGHDCLRVLGKALKKKFGNTNEFNGAGRAKTLGRILRLAYDFDFFRQTNACQEIRKWETVTGFKVLQGPLPHASPTF